MCFSVHHVDVRVLSCHPTHRTPTPLMACNSQRSKTYQQLCSHHACVHLTSTQSPQNPLHQIAIAAHRQQTSVVVTHRRQTAVIASRNQRAVTAATGRRRVAGHRRRGYLHCPYTVYSQAVVRNHWWLQGLSQPHCRYVSNQGQDHVAGSTSAQSTRCTVQSSFDGLTDVLLAIVWCVFPDALCRWLVRPGPRWCPWTRAGSSYVKC